MPFLKQDVHASRGDPQKLQLLGSFSAIQGFDQSLYLIKSCSGLDQALIKSRIQSDFQTKIEYAARDVLRTVFSFLFCSGNGF